MFSFISLEGLSRKKLQFTRWYSSTRSFGTYQNNLRCALKCVLLNVRVKVRTMVQPFHGNEILSDFTVLRPISALAAWATSTGVKPPFTKCISLFKSPSVDCECDVPKITVDLQKSLENATVIYSNDPFPLGAIFQDDCHSSNGYALYWEVCECEEQTGFCNQIIPYGKKRPGRTKKLYPRLFDAGYLYIRCLVTDPKDPKVPIVYDYGYVKIILPPIVAKLEGPANVIKGNESVVTLSASESYDPEKIHKKTEGLVLTWYCGGDIISHDNRDGLSTVSPRDAGRCQGDGILKINSTLPVLQLNVSNSKGNRTYFFEVVAQKGDRSANATHKLRVDEPFIISIR